MANGSGQEPLNANLCLGCSQITAKVGLQICGHCGHIRVDRAQDNRFALIELYRALGVFLATGPRESLEDFMEATQTILDQTKQTMSS